MCIKLLFKISSRTKTFNVIFFFFVIYCLFIYNFFPFSGGDDLLPLFAYVVIRSRIPNPYSEFRFIEDFLNESLCKGEVNYFLVTYCTSLALISYLCDETLSTWSNTSSSSVKSDEISHSLPSCFDNPTGESKTVKKRPRTSSLIDVELENEDSKSVGSPSQQDSDFLSWAASLIRK